MHVSRYLIKTVKGWQSNWQWAFFLLWGLIEGSDYMSYQSLVSPDSSAWCAKNWLLRNGFGPCWITKEQCWIHEAQKHWKIEIDGESSSWFCWCNISRDNSITVSETCAGIGQHTCDALGALRLVASTNLHSLAWFATQTYWIQHLQSAVIEPVLI